MYLVTLNDDDEYGVELRETLRGRWSARVDAGPAVELELRGRTPAGGYVVLVDGVAHTFRVDPEARGFTLVEGVEGRGNVREHVEVVHAADMALDTLSSASPKLSEIAALTSPITGIVLEVLVEVGQRVAPGQPIAVIEAMKMENTLLAERDATVAAVCVAAGDTVFVDETLVRFE